ncbi:oxidoreductase [Nocardioides sp. W7]|uniref:oxidoreductase n=1 Tax=Nocardioides sp. W7 TaxID=2931390 RepID=UPI001FD4329D|nr:oxidoreductase [Nocardioides sp. W7]
MSALPTAAEVLAGVDLTGRTALVTGGYSGIGVEVVRALAGAGATVLVPARRPGKATDAVAGIDGVEVGALDLADQASVASYADGLLAAGRPLDVVIGNAGVMACPQTRVGPGWELQLATNHLGHFALVNRLAPLLGAGSRVVSVSSTGHHLSGFRWDDPWFETGYDKWLAYGQSKTANVLFAVHLAALGRERGVSAFSLHPGAILTSLGRHLQESDLDAVMTLDADGQPVLPDFRSPEQGAATVVWAATSPSLAAHSGAYLEDCGIAPVVPPGPQTTYGVKDYALDPNDAARLWAWSVEQTGVDGFGDGAAG